MGQSRTGRLLPPLQEFHGDHPFQNQSRRGTHLTPMTPSGSKRRMPPSPRSQSRSHESILRTRIHGYTPSSKNLRENFRDARPGLESVRNVRCLRPSDEVGCLVEKHRRAWDKGSSDRQVRLSRPAQ